MFLGGNANCKSGYNIDMHLTFRESAVFYRCFMGYDTINKVFQKHFSFIAIDPKLFITQDILKHFSDRK